MAWILPIVLIFTTALTWWLSGYDSRVTGEDRNADFMRRFIRCGITVPLVALAVLSGGLCLFILAAPLAVIWAGPISNLLAGRVTWLIDPEDKRAFDPRELHRELDKLAELVQSGCNEEAIALCRKLQVSGDANVLAMETMLCHLYGDLLHGTRVLASPPLAEAEALCAQGNFAGAETRLNLLLKREPENLAALLMLVRIYARDLRMPDRARATFEQIRRQPHVPSDFIAQARRAIDEWSGAVPARDAAGHGIESLLVGNDKTSGPPPVPGEASIDDLLKTGHLASAIEQLEHQIAGQPGNFDLWLKLAEAHAVHCADVKRAGRIIGRMEGNPAFTPEQIQLAQAKLKGWRTSSLL